MDHPTSPSRRVFLRRTGSALASLPLLGLAPDRLRAATGVGETLPLFGARAPHFAPARRTSSSCSCTAVPSHVDTFDYKPELYPLDGKTIDVKTFGPRRQEEPGPRRRAEAGSSSRTATKRQDGLRPVPERRASHVDDIAFIHSMYAESPIHGSAHVDDELRTDPVRAPLRWARGSLTAWQREPEPAGLRRHARRQSGGPISGAKNWSSGYMPASYQGLVVNSLQRRVPILNLKPPEGREPTTVAAAPARPAEARQKTTSPRAARTTPNSRPASPATSSPTACRSTRPRRSTSRAARIEKTREMYGLDRK